MANAVNYYQVLGVPEDASGEVIRQAYKKLALQWHPDKNPEKSAECEMKFKQISEAYQRLSNDRSRTAYDRGDVDDNGYDGDFSPYFMPAEDFFEMFFRSFRMNGLFVHRRDCSSSEEEDDEYQWWYQQEQEARQQSKGNRRKHTAKSQQSKMDRNVNDVSTTVRTVNGKKWLTKTYTDSKGRQVVERYEDGDLISTTVNGDFVKTNKKWIAKIDLTADRNSSLHLNTYICIDEIHRAIVHSYTSRIRIIWFFCKRNVPTFRLYDKTCNWPQNFDKIQNNPTQIV